jgi:hypothetical protein
MNKHNVNYSMTSCFSGSVEQVIINKRDENIWYFSMSDIIPEYNSEEKIKKLFQYKSKYQLFKKEKSVLAFY